MLGSGGATDSACVVYEDVHGPVPQAGAERGDGLGVREVAGEGFERASACGHGIPTELRDGSIDALTAMMSAPASARDSAIA